MHYLFIDESTGIINYSSIDSSIDYTESHNEHGLLILTIEDKSACLNIAGKYYKDGIILDLPVRPSVHHVWRLSSEAWVEPNNYLDILKSEISARVDKLAGETRLKYITTSPGQEATYTAKLQDAKAYIADGYPTDSTPFVWIHAEAAATGTTAQQVADLIVYTAGLWSQVGAQIEGARQEAKIKGRDATTAAELYAAEQAFKAAMAAL